MPAQLWLLRHGEAEPHGAVDDSQRALTARGERQSAAAGAALARLGIEFSACLTSPKLRALDTARLACESLGIEPEVDDRVLGIDDQGALDLVHEHEEEAPRLLLVGHEPDFSQTVHDLTGARVDFKKGGIAAVRLDPAPLLLVLLRPKELESLAIGG